MLALHGELLKRSAAFRFHLGQVLVPWGGALGGQNEPKIEDKLTYFLYWLWYAQNNDFNECITVFACFCVFFRGPNSISCSILEPQSSLSEAQKPSKCIFGASRGAPERARSAPERPGSASRAFWSSPKRSRSALKRSKSAPKRFQKRPKALSKRPGASWKRPITLRQRSGLPQWAENAFALRFGAVLLRNILRSSAY